MRVNFVPSGGATPILFPAVVQLGFDPLWIGLRTPVLRPLDGPAQGNAWCPGPSCSKD